ncbi:MAG: response regulator transcription factor [Nitrospira sp. BO4]|nr:response regulator transcription factor [Nitrospira sp. BO4]
MLRVMIADDHAIVRQGWRQIIAEGFEQMVVAETGSGRGVLDTVKDDLWSAVVLDVDLPDMNGLDVLKELKARRPDVPVVILSFHTETEYAVRAFRAGAKAYLTKDSAPDELLAALKKAMQGGRYVTVSLAEALAESFAHEAPTLLHQTLSDRELAVLCLIAKGKTLTETADQLCLSVSTVGTYRSRLLEKLKLRTTAELIRYALRHHLVQ